jgi:thiosulfate dehydrogenase (quinone) large subunit
MMFVFAYFGSRETPFGWPELLMHQTEAAFVIVAFGSILLGRVLRGIVAYELFAIVGGISAGFGLIMPFELAPFFFGARGEIMLGTIVLILVYPAAITVFIFLFLKILKPRHRYTDTGRMN